MNIQKLMKQAQEMQQRLAQELAGLEIEASSGGGAVKVRVNGQKRIVGLAIEPEVLDPSDPALVADLVTAAVNEALRQVDSTIEQRLGRMMPPGFG